MQNMQLVIHFCCVLFITSVQTECIRVNIAKGVEVYTSETVNAVSAGSVCANNQTQSNYNF